MVKAKHPELIAGSMADERAAFDAMKAAGPPVVADGEAIERLLDLRMSLEALLAGEATIDETIADLRTLLAMSSKADVERLLNALPDDECTICGKTRKQHHTGSGVGMCQIYPVFRSRKAAFSALVNEARHSASLTMESGDGR